MIKPRLTISVVSHFSQGILHLLQLGTRKRLDLADLTGEELVLNGLDNVDKLLEELFLVHAQNGLVLLHLDAGPEGGLGARLEREHLGLGDVDRGPGGRGGLLVEDDLAAADAAVGVLAAHALPYVTYVHGEQTLVLHRRLCHNER